MRVRIAGYLMVVASTIAGMNGCSESTGPRTQENSVGVIVSGLVRAPLGVSSATGPAAPASAGAVYVSLPPGSVPAGTSATITDEATGLAVTTVVVNGGFDPVPIAASVGDTLRVKITKNQSGGSVTVLVPVTGVRPLKIVRTSPPSGGHDVPLNAIMVIVFSEPIDSASLTTAAVQLLRDTTPVSGTVRFSSGANIIGEFHPTSLLSPQTAYRLTVAPLIRSLTGGALTSPLSVAFTTGVDVQVQTGAQLVFTVQPSNATAGTVIRPPVVVTIEDSVGRTLTSDTNVVVLNLNGGPAIAGLGGTVAVKPVNGVATFPDLWIAKAATGYTLHAYEVPLVPLVAANSAAFDIAPVAPASLSFTDSSTTVAGIGAVLSVGVPFALDVAIVDSFYNTVTSATNAVTVRLGTSPSGATLGGTLTVDAVQGIAHFRNLSLDQAGPYTLVATAANLSPAQSSRRAFASGTFVAVSAGGAHSCGMTSTGTLYCWGSNSHGQLGDGTTTDRSTPVPVGGGLTFSYASTGGSHTCGVTPAGDAYCWGLNDHGQLGDGTTADRTSPVLVAGGLRFGGLAPGLPVLSAGASHTCGLVPNPSGEPFAYCWGLNDHGQLGDGTRNNQRTSPAPVAAAAGYGLGPLQIDAVSAGGSHSCGLNYDTGVDVCWGANSYGQLDDGTTTDRASPIRIRGGFNPRITTGAAHTCAIATVPVEGSRSLTPLYCWGANGNGQLGVGTTIDLSTWVPVGGGRSFSTVSAGGDHTCGVPGQGEQVTGQTGQWMAGDLYCWGLNGNGELGDGTTIQRTSPVLVAGGLAFVDVSAGASHTCGVTVAGVYCWGSNLAGQLGTGTTTSSSVPIKVFGQP